MDDVIPPRTSSKVISSSRSQRVFSSEKLFFRGDRRSGREQISVSISKRKEPYEMVSHRSLHDTNSNLHRDHIYSSAIPFCFQTLLSTPRFESHKGAAYLRTLLFQRMRVDSSRLLVESVSDSVNGAVGHFEIL